MYEKIKLWHKKGWWTAEMVAQAVRRGLITKEQYKSIVEETKNE